MSKLQRLTIDVVIVLLAVIVSMTFLAYRHVVNGDAVIALLSTIIGGVLVREGTKVANGKPPNGNSH